MFDSKSELSQADVKQARNFTAGREGRGETHRRRISNIFSTLSRRAKGGLAQHGVCGDVPPRLVSTSLAGN